MLQTKLQVLEIANKNHEASLKKSEGEKKQQAEQIDNLKGQPKNFEDRNTNFEEEHSKTKSLNGGLGQERNSLLDEAKQRDADLKQLYTKCEKMEKEGDTALDEVRAQKESSRRFQELGERKKREEAGRGSKGSRKSDPGRRDFGPGFDDQGNWTPRLNSEEGDEATEDDAD